MLFHYHNYINVIKTIKDGESLSIIWIIRHCGRNKMRDAQVSLKPVRKSNPYPQMQEVEKCSFHQRNAAFVANICFTCFIRTWYNVPVLTFRQQTEPKSCHCSLITHKTAARIRSWLDGATEEVRWQVQTTFSSISSSKRAKEASRSR